MNQQEKGHTTLSLVGSGGIATSERHKASITRIEAERRRNMEVNDVNLKADIYVYIHEANLLHTTITSNTATFPLANVAIS